MLGAIIRIKITHNPIKHMIRIASLDGKRIPFQIGLIRPSPIEPIRSRLLGAVLTEEEKQLGDQREVGCLAKGWIEAAGK